MKILIAGSDLNAIMLAQYIKLQDSTHDIYITSLDKSEDKSYTSINIRENDVSSICDFVKYNQIEFTIVTSQLAIINGIADTFKKEGFPIFAPFSEAARITFFNSIAKKIMYKLKINTPKFGIFDRENLAIDYVRHAKLPIVIENDFTLISRDSEIYETFSQAKRGLQKIFENNNERVVIESYIDIEPIYLYFITDGFNALPLISIERHSEKDFSIITAPSSKLSEEMIVKILKTALYPLLDDISKYAGNYTGVIGLKTKIYKDNFCIIEFYNGFQEYDFQAFLPLLSENFFNLLYDTSNGILAENHNYVNLNDKFSYSVAINKEKIIKNENIYNNYTESYDNDKIIITNTASTLNYAKEDLLDYIKIICEETTYKEITNLEKKAIKF